MSEIPSERLADEPLSGEPMVMSDERTVEQEVEEHLDALDAFLSGFDYEETEQLVTRLVTARREAEAHALACENRYAFAIEARMEAERQRDEAREALAAAEKELGRAQGYLAEAEREVESLRASWEGRADG